MTSFIKNPMSRISLIIWPLLALLISWPAQGEALFAKDDCRGSAEARYDPTLMNRKMAAYQKLSEETLSLRARAITYLGHLKEKQASHQPLLGSEISLLSAGAADLVKKRRQLWQVATAHECWLKRPIPTDPQQAQIQATGITMSLSAALTLYDNYLTAVALYRENPFLRQHINQGDPGYQVPQGELRDIANSFTSANNRARVRSGLIWYEKHGRSLAHSANDDTRYLAELVEQSPAYALVRKIHPLAYAGNMANLFETASVDTLHKIHNNNLSYASMIFGNTIGLVESRRGKLDRRQDVLQQVHRQLEAGDVLLEKTPFRLTDAFIPGHWGHAAIWIGQEEELQALDLWDHPLVVPHQTQIRQGKSVVEALRSGVEMNSLEHFMNIDDLGVLRHRKLNRDERREVILETLRQVGKAYDFGFDTQSANRIVCSELVYHAYGKVQWPTDRTLGRVVISPDNVAQKAVDRGPFKIIQLYHDGKEIKHGRRAKFAALIEPKVIAAVQGGMEDVSP